MTEQTESTNLPALWQKMAPRFLIAIVVLSPLPFGGVHTSSSLILQLIAIALLLWTAGSRRCFRLLSEKQFRGPGQQIFFMIFGFCLYVLVQTLAFLSLPADAPLAVTLSWFDRLIIGLSACMPFVQFLSLFAVTLVLCRAEPLFLEALPRNLLRVGILISLIGLGHWFSDNGMLFGVFAPDHVFLNHRARWPFVNPNHFAHYLLISIFLATGALLLLNRELVQSIDRRSKRPGFSLASFFSRSRTQRRISSIGLNIGLLVCLLIAVMASLSRSAWGALVFGSLMMLAIRQITPRFSHEPKLQSQRLAKEEKRNSSQRKRRRQPKIGKKISNSTLRERLLDPSRLVQFISGLILILSIVALINGRGVELVESRVTQGLRSSKSDLRFMLYSDSAAMFRDHPILGVGAGQWIKQFPTYMREDFANTNPVYLHSDLYQLLIEFGIVGTLFWISLVAIVGRSTLRVVRHANSIPSDLQDKLWTAITLSVGLLSLLFASLFDFPFRIPAISILCAVALGGLCGLLDTLINPTRAASR